MASLSIYSDPTHSRALRMRPREPACNTGSSLTLKGVEMGTPEAHALSSSLQPPSPLISVSRAQGPDLRANFSYSSSLLLLPFSELIYEYPTFACTPEINLLVSLAHCLLLLSYPLVSAFISRFPDPWPVSVIIHSSATGLDLIMPSLWCRKLASYTGSFHLSFIPNSPPPPPPRRWWENLCSFWDGVTRQKQIEVPQSCHRFMVSSPLGPF